MTNLELRLCRQALLSRDRERVREHARLEGAALHEAAVPHEELGQALSPDRLAPAAEDVASCDRISCGIASYHTAADHL